MDRIQKIEQAKEYLELLALSIDPTTDEVAHCPLLEKEEIRNVLQFAASLLSELMSNNGEVVQVAKPQEFRAERLDISAVVISDKPIQLSGFVTRINKQVDPSQMKRLGPSQISSWLVKSGYLKTERVSVVKEVKRLVATDTSAEIGISASETVDEKTGEITPKILLTRRAQEFIAENLSMILESE